YQQFYLWDEAAADFDKGFELQPPGDPNLWLSHAALRLYVGDKEGYRRACAGMLERFGQTTDASTVQLLARACTLGPGAVDDYGRLRQLAGKAPADAPEATLNQDRLIALHFRAGQVEQAVRRFETFSQKHEFVWYESTTRLLLILAYDRLGQKEKMKKWVE